MSGSMGERLAWARNQQGLILQQVSDRSGLAVGYISQLEKGVKVNPTVDALNRLARALGVSVAFILGEVPAPPYNDVTMILVGGQAWTIGQRFARHFCSLSPAQRERVALDSVEGRFAMVVQFLCDEFHETFTRAVVAYQLGLSVRALNDILERNCEVSNFTLQQMVAISGIPMRFFARGQLDAAAPELTPAQMLQYAEAISIATHGRISPEQLVVMIREYQSRASD